MARKETITKKMILDGAFQIMISKGVRAVSARKIAEEIGCSTQPIFRTYKNMSEIELELFEIATNYFYDYYINYPKENKVPFVDLGMAYVTFARNYRSLFELLFLKESQQGKSMYDLINGSDRGFVIQEIRKINDISPRLSSQIFMKMCIFNHGIACMVLSNDFDLSDSEMVQIMTDTFHAFYEQIK